MTERLEPDPAGLRRAADLLRDGRLVAFGTETVYGLGADATDDAAVARIFEAKARPRFNPLICHYPDAAIAFRHGVPNAVAERLAAALWPGPLTLVLRRRSDCPISLLAGAGTDTLAVRVPAHPGARALLAAVGRAVAAPSANRSGGVSPTTMAHVLADLDHRIDAVLDLGPATVGLESTVIDCTGEVPTLLRPGGVTDEQLAALSVTLAPPVRSGNLRSPGLLASHYAPNLPLRLDAAAAAGNEALLAFGPSPPVAGPVEQLSATGRLDEAAARLFGCLRRLDAAGLATGMAGIAAMPIPDHGLGVAIRDRLARAAAPR